VKVLILATITHRYSLNCLLLLKPESVTSQHYIAQALDSTAVRKIPTEPSGAAKIFLFHRKINILHSVLALKSRIQVKLKKVSLNKAMLFVKEHGV